MGITELSFRKDERGGSHLLEKIIRNRKGGRRKKLSEKVWDVCKPSKICIIFFLMTYKGESRDSIDARKVNLNHITINGWLRLTLIILSHDALLHTHTNKAE